MTDLLTALRDFNKDRKFNRKGPLCVALVVTQHARKMGLPLDPDKLLTDAGGQVLGLGKGAVQAVLNRHGITRVLAAEGGRTSRGSISNMREYVAFLNGQAASGAVDLDAVEAFWTAKASGSAFTSGNCPESLISCCQNTALPPADRAAHRRDPGWQAPAPRCGGHGPMSMLTTLFLMEHYGRA